MEGTHRVDHVKRIERQQKVIRHRLNVAVQSNTIEESAYFTAVLSYKPLSETMMVLRTEY